MTQFPLQDLTYLYSHELKVFNPIRNEDLIHLRGLAKYEKLKKLNFDVDGSFTFSLSNILLQFDGKIRHLTIYLRHCSRLEVSSLEKVGSNSTLEFQGPQHEVWSVLKQLNMVQNQLIIRTCLDLNQWRDAFLDLHFHDEKTSPIFQN